MSDVDAWRTWLAGACVNPLAIEHYATQLTQHRVSPDRCAELTEADLIAVGMSLLDAELCVQHAREQSLWDGDQFGQQQQQQQQQQQHQQQQEAFGNVIDVRRVRAVLCACVCVH
jgi:hypothetical protein